MMNKATVVVLIAALVATIASVLFLSQGGFGGGHGDFDTAIFVMGLPWDAIPWPNFLVKYDFVWLIGLPFVFNFTSVLLIMTIIQRRIRRSHRM